MTMQRLIPDPKRCGATNRQGERCGNWAVSGARVCRLHGGSLRRTKQAASRRLAEANAARSLAEQGVTPVGDPLEALSGFVAEVVAFKDYAGARVAELQSDLANRDRQGREEVRAMVALYERGLDRSLRALEVVNKLGIEERLTQLEERRAAIAEAVLVAVLRQCGIDPAAPDVRAVIHREFAALTPGRVVEVPRVD